MPEPLVSVLLSVNKDRGGLKPTIESALAQSLGQLELIVVNDGAAVKVRDTLHEEQAADCRVRIMENDPNLGLTRSLNRGLKQARGRYVARIDEGDLWLPTKLEQQVEFLESRPDYMLVGTQYRDYSDRGSVGRRGARLPTGDREIRGWLFSGLTPFLHPSIVFRRGILTYNDDARTSQDYDLYLRFSLVGRLHNLHEELVLYHRRRGGMISVDHEDLQFFNHARMHGQFLDVLRGRREPAAYIRGGTDFTAGTPLGAIRARYMKLWLRALCLLPKRSLSRRVLRNILIPDFLIYFLKSRSAPYRLRSVFYSYIRNERYFRP